jgi:hypothetical protein
LAGLYTESWKREVRSQRTGVRSQELEARSVNDVVRNSKSPSGDTSHSLWSDDGSAVGKDTTDLGSPDVKV